MNEKIVEAADLWKVYRMGEVEVDALQGVSLTIEKGDFVALLGPSGSGKSTLLHILGCLDTPTKGHFFFRGEDISSLNDRRLTQIRRTEIGFVFQTFNLISAMTVFENIEIKLRLLGIKKPERMQRTLETLELVNLKERRNHFPRQLSGGERQRVAIARAIIDNPVLLLADEPTGNLDSKTGGEIGMLLSEFNRSNNQTILLVTHDPEIAGIAGRILRMRDGKIEPEKEVVS